MRLIKGMMIPAACCLLAAGTAMIVAGEDQKTEACLLIIAGTVLSAWRMMIKW